MNGAISIHGVRSVTSQSRCLNGSWQLHVVLCHDNGDETILSLWGDQQIALEQLPDEYVRVDDHEPRVERSARPFEEGQ